ncbi:hypothetical protein GIB67_030246 [Kingdonia uniflora]|uniref:LRAT domain-containing protein n=1 Tax=Kingdonia uniflora TaxID=39325 RepID=A0A7J7MMX9_9MAGN|nr:hypothetical protein GIB67_030246 [Kingdonia uniflora]
MVIHYTSATIPIFCSSSSGSKCPTCGDQSSLEGVIFTCITCFLHGDDSNLRVFQYGASKAYFLAQPGGTCTIAPSNPTCDVLHRVYHLYHNNSFGGYNLFKNNCEDFAIYCKTGMLVKNKSTSGQVISRIAVTKVAKFTFPSTIFIHVAAIAMIPAAMSPAAIAIIDVSSVIVFVNGAMGPLAYCHYRYINDIGVRKDVEKVSLEELDTWSKWGGET